MDGPWLLIIAVFCFAAFLQGVTGFGYGMASMALLPLLMDFRQAALLVCVLGLSVNLFTLMMCRIEYDWRRGRALIVGAAIGVPLGVAMIQWVDAQILSRCLGGLICVFTLNELLMARHGWKLTPPWSAWPLGFLAGFFGAAFNIGGPPAIMYAYSQDWTKHQIVAVLQVLFLVIGGLRVALTAGAGLLDMQDLTLPLLTLLPMFGCIWIGRKFLDRVPQKGLRIFVFSGLLAMGVKYLLT